jgi:hypothetical protein
MAKKENPKTKNSVEKRKTIIVTDPKDKRLRAYNDSNELNKQGLEYKKILLEDYGKEVYLDKNKTLKRLNELNKYTNSTWRTESRTKDGKIIPYSKIAPIGFRGDNTSDNSVISPIFKAPVQPYVYKKPNNIIKTKPAYKLEKKKPVVKTPVKPVAKNVAKTVVKAEIKPAQKPVVKEEKTLYQGRNFMDSTGLRPNLYTKSEVANAARLIKEKKTKDKK